MLVCIILLASWQLLQAQQRTLTGVYDRSINLPTFEGRDGQQDASAIQALEEYVSATGLGRSGSVTLQGDIVISPDSQRQQGTATLTVEGSNRFRFDIHTSTGNVSTRIEGLTGSIQRDEQGVYRMPAETAMSGAIISPWTIETLLKDERLSVENRGIVSVDGSSLLKITLHRPLCLHAGGCAPDLQKLRLTTDLYLDPHTHLLIKSVETVRLSEQLPTRSLRVITYGDYHQLNGAAMVPFEYRETLNGQLIWNLTTTEASIGNRHEQSYFRF
jgi:hypothetical protein